MYSLGGISDTEKKKKKKKKKEEKNPPKYSKQSFQYWATIL